MNKKIFIIILIIALFASLTVNSKEYPKNPNLYIEAANDLKKEKPGQAIAAYHFAYIFSKQEKQKEEIEKKIKSLRKNVKYQRGYGFNNDIIVEFVETTESVKSKFGIENYTSYRMFIINQNDFPIQINSIMTKINAISKEGKQYEAINATNFMGSDVKQENMLELQGKLPANQKIYSESELNLLVLFKNNFVPKKIIVDGLNKENILDNFRVDVLFIGL
jgi:hypothetical protein